MENLHSQVLTRTTAPTNEQTTSTSTLTEPQQAAVNITSAPVQSTMHQLKPEMPPTLQMTSQVYVESHDERRLKAHALLDTGASLLLITQRLAQQLHLKKQHQPIAISGVHDRHCHRHQSPCDFFHRGVNQYHTGQHPSLRQQ